MVIGEYEKKIPDSNNIDLICYLFIVKHAVAHILVGDPSEILMIKTFCSLTKLLTKFTLRFNANYTYWTGR